MGYQEVRGKRAAALKASCIKRSRTKKPDDSKEWCWRERPFHGCNIFPGVLDQLRLPICQFCAITTAAQMELNATVAKWKPHACCNMTFQLGSLLTRFYELHGFKEEQGEEAKKLMEHKIFKKYEGTYDWEDGAAWCFKNLGVNAVVARDDEKGVADTTLGDCIYRKSSASNIYKRYWPNSDAGIQKYLENSNLVDKPKSVVNLGIDNYEYFDDLTKEEVFNYVEQGKAVVAGVFAGKQFDHLQADEIYSWIPKSKTVAGKHKWIDPPQCHAIVLMGNGDAGPTMLHEQYHPFVNSYGMKYADGGVGSVFYKGLFDGFMLLEIKDELKHVSIRMRDLDHDFPRPELEEV